MNPTLVSYLVYAVLSIALVAWVGHALKKNGALFLGHVFKTEDLAQSVNQLLLIGFYLVNIGFVSRQLRSASGAADATQAVELLADKIGVVALVLGAMHFFNLFVFSRMWKGRTQVDVPAPAAPPTPARGDRRVAPDRFSLTQEAGSHREPVLRDDRRTLPEIPGAPTSAAIPV